MTAEILPFPATGDPYMNVRQTAAYMGYSERWVQHAAKNLGLPASQPFGPRGKLKFRRSQIDAWMQERAS